MTALVLASWLLIALVAGGLALVSVGIVRAGRTFDAATWVTVHRALDRTIGPYLGALLVASIATTGAIAVSLAAVRTTYAIVAALLVVTLAISLSINVPINREVGAWTSPPTDWATRRTRWNGAQLLRSMTAFGALAVLAVRAFV